MSSDPALRRRTIVLVGMTGAGKSSIGHRLAKALGLPFRDADEEIEKAAHRSITEIFAAYGEPAFRDVERRVISRLLNEPPHVLATGGGAFMNEETRALIAEKAVSVWLKAEVDVIARRVARKTDRPLLQNGDPLEVLNRMARERNPVYALADIAVESGETPHHATVEAIIAALRQRLETAAP